MEKDIAIRVKNVSKSFVIPHEKIDSIRGAFVNMLKRKSYEKFKALDNVSFEVKKGEFFGIIGRNGSGKSTLLKILANIYETDKGKVEIDGMISPFLELGIGFNPDLSGRDNIYLNASVLGLSRKEIDEKFDSIVKFSELERFIDQKLKNYSSGMQVRLAFSVSIHANRDILLMDEVLAVGDNNFQSKCLEEFNKYKELGKTVILVAHDTTIIQQYCDRALLLQNGKVIDMGQANSVVDKYIQMNMQDEEKRINSSKKEKEVELKPISNKSKIAQIKKIEFLNKDGKPKNVFEMGDDISVRVYFTRNRPDVKLNFGIALFNIENDIIFGINTLIDKIDTEEFVKRGYYQLDYTNVPLKTNAYFVKSSIFGDIDSVNYDFCERSKTFQVFSAKKNRGIIQLNYNWK